MPEILPTTTLPAPVWRALMGVVGSATWQEDGGHLIRIDEPIDGFDPGIYRCGEIDA